MAAPAALPEFKGNVAAVYTHPLSRGGSSGNHYGSNAETYMNVGEAMGKAMVELLANEKPKVDPKDAAALAAAEKLIAEKQKVINE